MKWNSEQGLKETEFEDDLKTALFRKTAVGADSLAGVRRDGLYNKILEKFYYASEPMQKMVISDLLKETEEDFLTKYFVEGESGQETEKRLLGGESLAA